MKTGTLREWRNKDKSDWGPGPWQTEPDKRQWVDAATGLPCMMIRGHMGFWCGYVGVPEGHPLYGDGYDAAYDKGATAHGGLTFAGPCHPHDEAQWQKYKDRSQGNEGVSQGGCRPVCPGLGWLYR